MALHVGQEEKRIASLESEIVNVRAEIEKVIRGEDLESDDPELATLVLENSKLKHRLSILKKAVLAEKSNSSEVTEMVSILDHLTNLFSTAIASSFPTLQNVPTVIAPGTNPKDRKSVV